MCNNLRSSKQNKKQITKRRVRYSDKLSRYSYFFRDFTVFFLVGFMTHHTFSTAQNEAPELQAAYQKARLSKKD
jgi:hypothetical protein